jgi:glycosyltransferase involved in cell wall biosynthesis
MALFPDPRPGRRYVNREGRREYDFTLPFPRARPGVSAMVRARNEAANIAHCLRSILAVFDEVVVLDNCSDDGTPEIVRDLQRHHGHGGKIRLRSYPFRLARFGPEHDATAADSLRSAVYFSNWSLAQCSHRHVCKWDGDMVLAKAARPAFDRLLEAARGRRLGCWTLAGQTLYRAAGGEWYLALGEVNREVELFPNGWGYRFKKRRHWEGLSRPALPRKRHFGPVAFYELKCVDRDEFAHWSTSDWPSERKRREWSNYQAVKAGRLDPQRFRALPRSFLDDEVA